MDWLKEQWDRLRGVTPTNKANPFGPNEYQFLTDEGINELDLGTEGVSSQTDAFESNYGPGGAFSITGSNPKDAYLRNWANNQNKSKDKGFDALGWLGVLGGLGQAAANWKTASAMEKQIPIFQGELDFKKASFREKQDKYDTLHNNAINQQKELLKSAFFADPTRAASLRTIG